MEIIEFYEKNLCDYTIIKKYYKKPIIILILLYLLFIIIYFVLVWLVNIRLRNNNSVFHDVLFSVCIGSIIMIPNLIKLKEHFYKANLNAVKELCDTYSLHKYHIRTSKYNSVRKIILFKYLEELELDSKEKLDMIISKIRFEYLDKKFTRSKRNFIIALVFTSIITSLITTFFKEYSLILVETKNNLTSNIQVFIFNGFAVTLLLFLILSINSVFNMSVSAFEDMDRLKKYSYLLELEEIINEKLLGNK